MDSACAVRYRFGDLTKQIFRNEHQRTVMIIQSFVKSETDLAHEHLHRIKDLVVKEVVRLGLVGSAKNPCSLG